MKNMLNQESIDYLELNPITSDVGKVSNEEIIARLNEWENFPDNIKKILKSAETVMLMNKIETTFNLSREQSRGVSETLRKICFGEESAASLSANIKLRTATDDVVAGKIAVIITKELISKNYFQISQLYERKHRVGATPAKTFAPRQPLAGRPLESLEQKQATIAAASVPGKPTTSMGDWAGEIEQEDQSTQIVANKPSRNVVDLRKSPEPLPIKLPPTPPVVSRPE